MGNVIVISILLVAVCFGVWNSIRHFKGEGGCCGGGGTIREKKKTAKISYSRQIDDELLKSAVTKLGYEVVSIS